MSRPIIATLLFPEDVQQQLQELRDRWFPPKLNIVPAHLTLFHHLPGDAPDKVEQTVEKVCDGFAPFGIRAEQLTSIGGGFAAKVASDELSELRSRIADRFEGQLTGQDSQGFRAHVTFQNKVTKDTARLCLAEAEQHFTPIKTEAEGVQLWFYDGGPWEAFTSLRFSGR
jgi:2'-5' RNA ligase